MSQNSQCERLWGRGSWIVGAWVLLFTTVAWGQEYRYTQTVEYNVRGMEYRNFNSYPEDRRGNGYRANAKADVEQVCEDLMEKIGSHPQASNVECTEPRDIEPRRGYSTWQSRLTFDLSSEAHFVKSFDEIDGGKVLADDYSNDSQKWQTSRRVARERYFAACAAFTEQMEREFGEDLVIVDCGIWDEDGGKDGWRYFSTPTVYVAQELEDIPACSNGRREDQVWWDTVPNAIQEPINCEFGGDRTDTYDQEVQRTCQEREIEDTGRTRRGEFRGSTGACNAPLSCGDRDHDERWVEIGDRPIRVDVRCEFGGNRYDEYERELVYSCYNGDTRLVDTRRGAFRGSFGSCFEPAGCGIHDHGDFWWDNSGRIRDPQFCRWGGNRVDVYEELSEFQCFDGRQSSTGRTRRGRFLFSRGSCNPPPRMMPRPMPPRMMPMPRPMPPRMMPMPRPMPRPMPPRMMPMPRPMPRPMPPRMMPMPRPMPRPMPPRMMPMPRPMPRPMPPRMMPMPRPMPRPMPPRMMPMPRPMPRPMPPRMMPMPRPMPRPMPPRMMPMPRPMPRPMPPRMMPRPMPPRMMPMGPMRGMRNNDSNSSDI